MFVHQLPHGLGGMVQPAQAGVLCRMALHHADEAVQLLLLTGAQVVIEAVAQADRHHHAQAQCRGQHGGQQQQRELLGQA